MKGGVQPSSFAALSFPDSKRYTFNAKLIEKKLDHRGIGYIQEYFRFVPLYLLLLSSFLISHMPHATR